MANHEFATALRSVFDNLPEHTGQSTAELAHVLHKAGFGLRKVHVGSLGDSSIYIPIDGYRLTSAFGLPWSRAWRDSERRLLAAPDWIMRSTVPDRDQVDDVYKNALYRLFGTSSTQNINVMVGSYGEEWAKKLQTTGKLLQLQYWQQASSFVADDHPGLSNEHIETLHNVPITHRQRYKYSWGAGMNTNIPDLLCQGVQSTVAGIAILTSASMDGMSAPDIFSRLADKPQPLAQLSGSMAFGQLGLIARGAGPFPFPPLINVSDRLQLSPVWQIYKSASHTPTVIEHISITSNGLPRGMQPAESDYQYFGSGCMGIRLMPRVMNELARIYSDCEENNWYGLLGGT